MDEPEQMISVELPVKYWILVLGALSVATDNGIAELEKMAKAGFTKDDLKQLSPDQLSLLAGPAIAKSMIVDVLAAHGVIKPEGANKSGTAAIVRVIQHEQGIE